MFWNLDLEDSKLIFSHHTLTLIMQYYIKFSYKRFSSSEDIALTNIHWLLNLFFVTLTTITGGSCHKYNFCYDKYFVATSILLLHQKMCFVATNLLSWQKLYLWQLPPMIDHSSPIFHWSLWLMMMHHQTKSGCKKFSRPDVLCSHILIIWALWPWPWREQINFLNDILAHHDASPYSVLCPHRTHTHRWTQWFQLPLHGSTTESHTWYDIL